MYVCLILHLISLLLCQCLTLSLSLTVCRYVCVLSLLIVGPWG